MSTTTVLATALPYSLAADAPFHCSVFFTHRLTPDTSPESARPTLALFPDTVTWVKTLLGAELVLVADTAPDGIPVKIVSSPDQGDWDAVFPPSTPVVGFATPQVTDQKWKTYPAHAIESDSLATTIGSTVVSPLSPPTVQNNPVVDGFLNSFSEHQESVAVIRNLLVEAYAVRDQRNLARKVAEATATLGMRGQEFVAGLPLPRGGYVSEPNPWTNPVEVLLADTQGERHTTALLDRLIGTEPQDDPAVMALRRAHETRRFYQREEQPYAEVPVEGASSPRPEVPVQDFHARAGSLGSTPALLRTLGLAVDVRVDKPADRQLLARAKWVSARLTGAEGSDVVRLAPPRTRCESDGTDHWRAVSSDVWSGGALPLGSPDDYTVLDLDPDASGLKLEQHLRNLPRALATELNGDPVNAAPGSLRSTGFSIAQVDRDRALLEQVQRAESFEAVEDDGVTPGPDLLYDDVVRGIRLEVWDDDSAAWHSVHERLVTVTAGGRSVLEDEPDTGFLQLTGLTRVGEDQPFHLHEVFVGWDGWSLSAPRPGGIIVHNDGSHGTDATEVVLPEQPDNPDAWVRTTSRVGPGTLPWLRYGRRYSFRVRGVDLAGNTVPRPAGLRVSRAEISAAGDRLDQLRSTYAEQERAGLLGSVRDQLLERMPSAADGSVIRALAEAAATEDEQTWEQLDEVFREAFVETGPVTLPELAVTGVEEVDGLLRSRVVARAAREREVRGAGLRRGVTVALGEVLRHSETWRLRPQLDLTPDDFARLDDTRDPIRPPAPTAPVVTTPRPFLRWHPVPPPSLVARAPLGTGESLQRLVVRDDQPAERHVAPPKGTQLEAEQHGMFDKATGSSDPAVHDAWLAMALKERGTFLDEFIQDLADPNGQVQQEGIALHSRPGADPDAAVTLAEITTQRDTPLGEGQYVVHDTDQLVLPYLPDVLAHGVSLVFYDAGAPHTLAEPRVLQTALLPYAGGWPSVDPLRLVLVPGAELGARQEGSRVEVTLPPGEQVRVAMSSALDEEKLQVLGLWATHAASAAGTGAEAEAARAVLARAAANGWFWWLTPSHDLRLVHAVRRPVHPPELPGLRVLIRPAGLTVAALVGVVDVHGPSTERIVLVASWSEWVDDLSADGPTQVNRQDVVMTSAVQQDERFGLLYLIDAVLPGEDGNPPVVSHQAIQNFPDTHHREVSYAARGVTRYAEFFDPAELPAADDPTLSGQPRELTIQSSARPSVPEVSGVVPLLLWEQETEPDQPFALRRTRRSGARVWLHRPWFSSGDGELLAVVLGTAELPPSLTSRWAKDPVQVTGVPASTPELPLVAASDLFVQFAVGEVFEPAPGRPVTVPVQSTLVDAGRAPVMVLGYQPEFHPGRKQWFVDIAMDPGDSLWPFVRLALARYQPDSLPGHDLSPVALADWVQPLPERIATANRRTEETVRMTVTGPIGITRLPRRGATVGTGVPGTGTVAEGSGPLEAADGILRASRELFVTIQEAPGAGGGDLEWTDHARERLLLVGLDGLRATWSVEVPLPEPVPMATPGSSKQFRVLVEEIEYFDADPDEGPKEGVPATAQRVVYADHFPL
ncbi:hypothetical protein NF556_00560 [Ornithinimicrobium faecis]|uniref:Uncharacterized protein n=1 Tax=Ornithinimicrobium faecis TaxID=2934158 RepID=A0ABY4YTY6_9MICO|nr:hypothetical protein [Ornithinimicrobium sp. HY1793]USQ80189.1 hypothetical protein NF556_00560 [Ornithinimicrobium sp. HY1793]